MPAIGAVNLRAEVEMNEMKERIKKDYPPVNQMNQDQRIEIVKDIFSTVTNKYDFLNRFLSLRQDIKWRRKTVQEMRFFKSFKLPKPICSAYLISICTLS